MIFFDNKGPVLQIPVPRGKTVTAKFYRNVALKKLKLSIISNLLPKTGLKHLRLLHDKAPAHKAPIVIEFLVLEVKVLPHLPYSPDLAPCDYFLFLKQ